MFECRDRITVIIIHFHVPEVPGESQTSLDIPPLRAGVTVTMTSALAGPMDADNPCVKLAS